jgi:hypothetical protein
MRSCPVSRKEAIENIPTDVNDLSTAIENYLEAKVGLFSQLAYFTRRMFNVIRKQWRKKAMPIRRRKTMRYGGGHVR